MKLIFLQEALDSMVDTEYWYAEGGSRAEGRGRSISGRQTKKWWLPSPRVPESGLSIAQRKWLGFQGKFVRQVLKAAKSINVHVLLQMPLPASRLILWAIVGNLLDFFMI